MSSIINDEETLERTENEIDEFLMTKIQELVDGYSLNELLTDRGGELLDNHGLKTIPEIITEQILNEYEDPQRWSIYDFTVNFIDGILKENNMI